MRYFLKIGECSFQLLQGQKENDEGFVIKSFDF